MTSSSVRSRIVIGVLAVSSVLAAAAPAHAQQSMWSAELGGGWRALGMAQAFPIVTVGAPGRPDSPLRATEWAVTQPAVMADLVSPRGLFTLRTTINLEGLTIDDGELTPGAWGEGFLDKRHPHSLVHELMLSMNISDVGGGALAFSAGKGFAPYGTDDPMSRPALKYPTNHHLSQILERWTLNGMYVREGWSLELGWFGGAEPDGPYDLSNIESFGDSWSARLTKRWGAGTGPMAEWEASVSYGSVLATHDGERDRTSLWNVALRHAGSLGSGRLYALIEASRADPEDGGNHFSVLAEARLHLERHAPYLRVEFAVRPEYARKGLPGTEEFFLYDHDAEPIGATRWFIGTIGYSYALTGFPLSVRPFAEAQYHEVRPERGGIQPEALFGTRSFWNVTLGTRVYLGGAPMRMGAYGVLDPMTAMHGPEAAHPHGRPSTHEMHR